MNNFDLLLKYFRKKYALKSKGEAYRMVADELGITERHLRNIISGKTKPSLPLTLLVEHVVKELVIKDLILRDSK